MKNVIVSGANGFIGRALVSKLIEENIHVLAIDMEGCSNNIPSHDLVTFMKFDMSDSKALIEQVKRDKYDTFIHLAWVGSSGPQRTDYNLQINNAIWTAQCMEVAKTLGCTRFVCAGSIMEKEVMAIINQQGIKPGMGYIYGLGKLIAHSLCKSLANKLEIDLVWAVITNAYGVGELSPRFINTTLRKIINNDTLSFTEASQNYDFVYITDVADAFYLISKKGIPFCEYLIGSSSPKPLKSFIIELAKSVSYEKELNFGTIPYEGINLPLYTYSTYNTEVETGFKARKSFADGVCKTMEWLKEIV